MKKIVITLAIVLTSLIGSTSAHARAPGVSCSTGVTLLMNGCTPYGIKYQDGGASYGISCNGGQYVSAYISEGCVASLALLMM